VGGKGVSTHLEALLACLDGGDVASDTAADDDEVLLLSLGGVGASPSRDCDGGEGGPGESRANRSSRY
jgi:hypothetical protein